MIFYFFFFFKQKTAYEMRISDWSSDVCSSDLARLVEPVLRVALDVPTAADARQLVATLGDAASFYKIGMELLMAPGFFELLASLKADGKKVFVDLKFFDIPETVARAVRNLSERGADFCTIHGNQLIMEAAAKAKSGDRKST